MMTAVFFALLLLQAPERTSMTDNAQVPIVLHYPSAANTTQSIDLAFTFAPANGIHVNAAPVIELVLEKKSRWSVTGTPTFTRTADGYLDAAAPVTFSLSVKRGTKPGPHRIHGTLNYFYCSDSEGWCNKFSQPITLTIGVHQ